jgi:phosphate transport system substrate-binding protein
MRKIVLTAIRGIATITAWAAAILVLYRYEYLAAFFDIDNIVGMLPVALAIAFAAGITLLSWLRFSRQNRAAFITLGAVVLLSAALYPTALRGNWWIGTVTSDESETRPDLTVYAPFAEDTLAVRLDEEATLRLSGSLPVLDGATALYPVYAAFAQAVYDFEAFSHGYVLCTNTRNAYESIISGEVDIIFVAKASEQQLATAEYSGADLHFTPIGREAFVFLVGNDNPIDSISQQQIRNIYSGKTAHWNTLGWRDGGRIIAFQRPEGSGSQTGLQFFMGNMPIQVPQPLPHSSLIGTNSLMNQVSVEWNGVQPALGYSYRYFAAVMYANPEVKLLKIDGIEPSIENIRNGSYPFTADFYAVTNGEPQGNVKLLIDWILSPQGQEIVERTGYTALG